MLIPPEGAFTLRNATVPASVMGEPGGALRRLDIEIANGRIAGIQNAGAGPRGEGHDLDDGIVLPAFVDLHTHLDKGHIWPRKANPDGTWLSALIAVGEDRLRNWAAGDVERRMDFALRSAYAHGTAAIRTHLDCIPPQHTITFDVFETMRERWAGRVELQGVSLISPDIMLDPGALDEVAQRTRAAGAILGSAIHSHPDSKLALLRVVEKAGNLGLDLDVHVDETSERSSSSLLHLAEAVIETGYTGKVVAGHCCVLALQDDATAAATIERTAAAGIAVVSLPMCNLYLQDRAADHTPRWRGVTLVHELRAAGVQVAIASDNTRDPFYAYGDLDCFEVLREGARILHFDHPQSDAWDWARTVTAVPAEIGGFTHRGKITIGQPADLVLFRARTWTELFARPQADRIVLRDGKPIDRTLPDYRELDDLME